MPDCDWGAKLELYKIIGCVSFLKIILIIFLRGLWTWKITFDPDVPYKALNEYFYYLCRLDAQGLLFDHFDCIADVV